MKDQKEQNIELIQAQIDDLDLVCDLVDCSLRGDAFIPRGQMIGVLRRPTSEVWLVLVDDQIAGFAIMYSGSTLHNLHLSNWARGNGIGSKVVALLRPKVVRSKSNMRAGDPTPFYQRNGFVTQSTDTKRPHINIMVPATEAAEVAATFTLTEEESMLQRLRALFSGVPSSVQKSTPPPIAAAIVDLKVSKQVTISEEEYTKMRKEVEQFRVRKAKQAGYQRKRHAENGKMDRKEGVQNALIDQEKSY